MTEKQLRDPEDQMLLDFLDAQRNSVLAIVEGLDEDAWHRSVVPSGWTPAGLVEHLAGAEWHWFQGVVTGASPELPGDVDETPYDPTAAFVADLPSAEIIGEYREQCALSDAVLAVTPLSALPGWQARRAGRGRTTECALDRAAYDRGDRATCRSPGHRPGTKRRPDRARAALTGKS